MAPKIKIRRGTQAQLPTLELAEFGFTTDNKELYIGNGVGNTHFPSETYVSSLIAAGGGGVAGNLASLNALNSTSYATTTTWTNISFPTIVYQNQTDIIELDTVDTSKILIKKTGTYFIYYCSTVTVQTGSSTIVTTLNRILRNDILVDNSEHSVRTYPGETHNTVNTISVDLVDGDYLNFQISRGSENNVTVSESRINIVNLSSLQGEKGDPGPPGAGSSISVYNNGVAVSGTPHTTLDFTGNLSVADVDGDRVTIGLPLGFYTEISSDGYSSTTSNSFQNKLTTTLSNLPYGKYKVGWYYEWGFSSTSSSFRAMITVNSDVIAEHYQEVKDSNAAQWHNSSGFYYYTGSGNTTINLDYCASSAGQTARIQRARLEVWRVS